MSIIKSIKKNKLRRKVSNEAVCGICRWADYRKPGDLELKCLKKKKLVSVINFELNDPEKGSCFELNESGIKWNL